MKEGSQKELLDDSSDSEDFPTLEEIEAAGLEFWRHIDKDTKLALVGLAILIMVCTAVISVREGLGVRSGSPTERVPKKERVRHD